MPSRGAGVWLAALWLLLLAGPGLRGERLAGGLQEVLISDPGVQEAVRFAVEAYNQASNSLHYSRAERVLRACSQVVAGIKYYLTVQLVTTQCQKNGAGLGNKDISTCPLPPASEQQKLLCEFQVWSRPWLNETQLLFQNCSVSDS
ncbi:small nuclear ribonucleoprotein F-like [Platysternon megacephalum]|uniref:Egg-white cystatin n=1 Tax=Platysternon megacephalum TaxID=55544 RepID=A0A4D9ESE7_9SAUR|nr:small nuclear ribonucleoprotein F-like [Platysternon megacephalum]